MQLIQEEFGFKPWIWRWCIRGNLLGVSQQKSGTPVNMSFILSTLLFYGLPVVTYIAVII